MTATVNPLGTGDARVSGGAMTATVYTRLGTSDARVSGGAMTAILFHRRVDDERDDERVPGRMLPGAIVEDDVRRTMMTTRSGCCPGGR